MKYDITNQFIALTEAQGILQNMSVYPIRLVVSVDKPNSDVDGLYIQLSEKFTFKAPDGKQIYLRTVHHNTTALVIVEDCVNFKQPAPPPGAGVAIDDGAVTTNKTWSSKKIKSVQDEKLNLSGGTMTGDIIQSTAPTLSEHLANKTYVDTAISALVDGAPEGLATLSQLAAALQADDNMSTTILNLIGEKLDAAEATTSPTPGKVLRLDSSGDLQTNAATATRFKNPVLVNGQIWYGDTDIDITAAVKIEDWETNRAYKKDDIVIYNNLLYRATQPHTSSNQFTSDMMPGAEKWQMVGGASGSGGGSAGYSQITKLGVTAPKQVDIVISNTNTFNLPPVEVLKFVPGPQNQVTTVCAFDNADADDFTIDGVSGENAKYVSFDGMMQLNTAYTIAMSEPIVLEDGFISESEEIDFAEYKKVEAVG